MRREHNSGSASPTPTPGGVPFAEDLIFWAPLTEGDLTDHISGASMYKESDSDTYSWDASKQMYRFNGQRHIRAPFYWMLPDSNFFTKPFTLCAQVIDISTGSQNVAFASVNNFDTGNSYPLSRQYFSTSYNTPYDLVLTNEGSTSKAYRDAVLVNTLNWSSQPTFKHVTIGYDWNQYSLNAYVKDIRIYKRVLSASEVEQVYAQSHEVAPSSPTNVTAVLNGSVSSVLVSWNASIGATSYKVYRSSSSSGTYTLLSTVNATSYTDNSPLTGMNYYKIIASNSYGDSGYSSAASVDTSVIPATPTGLTATPVWDSGLETVVVELRWNPSAYANGYRYYRSTSASGTYTLINTIGNIQVTDTPSAGITYYYKVSSLNSNGESALSSYVSVDTSATIPSAPTGLDSAIDGSTIDLRWDASSGATSYEVYRSTTESGTYTLVTTVTTTSTSITALNGDNYIKVKAVNSAGSSDFSSYTYQNYAGSSGLIFHTPLLSDNKDIIGKKTPISGYTAPVSYDPIKGAQFSWSHDKYLVYRLTKAETESVTCVYCEYIPVSGSSRNQYLFQFGSPDLLTNGLYIMSSWINTSLKQNITSQYLYSNYGFDSSFNYQLTSNNNYKIAIYQYSSSIQKVYINGSLVFTNSNGYAANNNYYTSSMNDSNCGLVIGSRAIGRTGSNARVFNGYIKNFKLFDKTFTEQELITLTT